MLPRVYSMTYDTRGSHGMTYSMTYGIDGNAYDVLTYSVATTAHGSGFRVQGSGFRVQG